MVDFMPRTKRILFSKQFLLLFRDNGEHQYNLLSNELKAVYLAQLIVYSYGNNLKSLLVEPSSHGSTL